MLFWGITASGQGSFNPTSPAEPGAPTIYSRIVLQPSPSEGGSVSGSGRYAVGTVQRVYAYVSSGYKFNYWTNSKGDVLSTATSFSFTNTEVNDTLIAHFVFDPSSPSEPVLPSSIQYFKLSVAASNGGSVSGGGTYQAGKEITLSAYAESGYSFLNWTNESGEVVSNVASFRYTTKDKKETLTANFRFDPNSPTEPTDPVVRHRINVSSSDGGSTSGSSGLILTGQSVTLYASPNSGYSFVGWYRNGEFYTGLSSFSFTMGNEDVDFHAKFKFNPASPSEPLMPALDKYSYYLMTVNGLPGKTIEYPLFMANSADAKDMTFQLTFPTKLMPRMNEVLLSDKAVGYTTSATALNDSVYVFSMIGGALEAATTKLLTFYVDVPDDMLTGTSLQVKINQLSVTQPDGTTVTAHTRNGRIGVYKRGDANGDDNVDILDVVLAIKHINGFEDESFIKEAANINDDENLDILDVDGIKEIVLGTETK